MPRTVIDAFSTRRAEIEAAMASRGLGDPAANQRMAERAALVTRSHKRDVDKDALRETWQRQASELGFDAQGMVAEARHWQATFPDQHLSSAGHDREAEPGVTAEAQRAAAWAVAHLSEREAVFARTDLLTATLAWNPGKVSIEEAEAAVGLMEKEGTLHAARTPVLGDALTTDKALIDETETIALMERGQSRSKPVMRKWIASPLLHNGRLTQGPEGGGDHDPVLEGPGRWRAGLCRHGQDRDAGPGALSRGQERLAHGRPGALGLGGGDAPGARPASRARHCSASSPATRAWRRGG